MVCAIVSLLSLVADAFAFQQHSCRIENQLTGSVNLGSGTLIDVTDDGQYGFVLTCAHLFDEGRGRVTARFADGSAHAATLLRIDRAADLAALEIVKPRSRPVAVSFATSRDARYTACGFGPTGRFACVTGAGLGTTASSDRMNLRLRGSVRSGDSGGGVFDSRGRIVGVIWGTAEGVTYASAGKPLERFLQSTLGRRFASVVDPSTRSANSSSRLANCPDGRCPLVPQRPQLAPRLLKPPQAACRCDPHFQEEARSRLGALEKELAGRAAKPASDPPARSEGWYPTNRRLVRLAVPMGTICLALLALIGWWRNKRKQNSRFIDSHATKPTQEATAAADATFPEASRAKAEVDIETSAPIERDDREARQLLRLSQLEGRDPLQDALAGRLALDRLDEIAESHGADATFADGLRRELRERFNEVAPTKFTYETKP